MLIIELPGGCYFEELRFKLVSILTGEETNENVVFDESFRFVERIDSGGWFNIYPMTIRRYITKYSKPGQDDKIYELFTANMLQEFGEVRPGTNVETLSWTSRKLLSLWVTFSWTDKIVFDLLAIDPVGGNHIYNLVKRRVAESGAAVLIDYVEDDFKDNPSQRVRYRELV